MGSDYKCPLGVPEICLIPVLEEHTSGKKTTLISNSLWKTLREIDLRDSPTSRGVCDNKVAVTLSFLTVPSEGLRQEEETHDSKQAFFFQFSLTGFVQNKVLLPVQVLDPSSF